MGKIIMSDNVSLDGVVQDPAGDEGFRVGGWVGVIAGRPELAKVTLDEALGTEALLLGRRSYEWLAARWPSRTGARLITDEGVAVGGAFDGDTATGMMPVAHRVAGVLASRRS